MLGDEEFTAQHFPQVLADKGQRCLYLNASSRTPMPASVHAAGARSLALKGADANDIALTPSTGFAMTLAAFNVGRSPVVRHGMSIVVLADQMASNVYPWQFICSEHGLKLVVVEEPDDGN
eukprot:gene26789-29054_t